MIVNKYDNYTNTLVALKVAIQLKIISKHIEFDAIDAKLSNDTNLNDIIACFNPDYCSSRRSFANYVFNLITVFSSVMLNCVEILVNLNPY